MDAIEFIKERQRLCQTYVDCFKCPAYNNNTGITLYSANYIRWYHGPGQPVSKSRLSIASGLWLRSMCSICSYRLNLRYGF